MVRMRPTLMAERGAEEGFMMQSSLVSSLEKSNSETKADLPLASPSSLFHHGR